MFRKVALLFAFLLTPALLLCQKEGSPRTSPSSIDTAPIDSERSATSPFPQSAKFNAQSNLVLVPVIVTDKSGKHVSDLRKEAFRIEENDRVRGVSVFEEMKTERLIAPAKASESGVYSNFVGGDDRPSRFTAILLDMINTPALKQIEVKRQLADYLLRSVTQDEPVAIFGLNGGGLHQLHSFTTDTKVLIDALQKLKSSLSSAERTQPEETTGNPYEDKDALAEALLMDDFMRDDSDTLSAGQQRIATRKTLAALTQLAYAFQTYPGRKSLIWASAGFPFTIDDPQFFAGQDETLRSEYEETWRLLNSSNIAVYPVDLGEGDMSSGPLPSASSAVPDNSHIANYGGGNTGLKPALRLPYDAGSQQKMTLRAFADSTGGQTCLTFAELGKCFAKAVDDSRDYYLLGYYLGDDVKPGWRKLKVKVSGDGLHVRYRSGFYVAPEVKESDSLRRKQFVDALASPVAYSGLRLTARLLQSSGSAISASEAGGKRHVQFMLGVMGNSIAIDREKGNAIDLEVISLAFDKNRKSVATASQAIATGLNPEMMRKTLQSGLGIPEALDLYPGKYEVKFAVRDNATGLLGTVSVPIELK